MGDFSEKTEKSCNRRKVRARRQAVEQCASLYSLQLYNQTPAGYGDCKFFRYYHFPKRGEHSKADKGSGGALNDSIWATILGIAKIFGKDEKYALYEISYTNAVMYSRAVPLSGDIADNDGKPLYDDSLDANNPANFTDDDIEEEIIRI